MHLGQFGIQQALRSRGTLSILLLDHFSYFCSQDRTFIEYREPNMSEPLPLDDELEPEIGESSRRTRWCTKKPSLLHKLRSTSLIHDIRHVGNRSVSGMTVAQRERKRANDRRSQRASRARTRQHIQHLERELESLRHIRPEDGGDESAVIQELIRRNQELEIELIRLRSTSVSPLSTNPSHCGIPVAGRVNAPNPGEPLNTEAPSTYLSEGIPPVDDGNPMASLMTLSSSSVTDNFGEASGTNQNLVNYTMPNQYPRIDFPRSPPNLSRPTAQYRQYGEESGPGTRRQELRYPAETSMTPFAASSSTGAPQVGMQPFTRQSASGHRTEEYEGEGQGPVQPLSWDQWQVGNPGGEAE